jgi:hypothetical protein
MNERSERTMSAAIVENPHAGQGRAVPLDIGGDVGALVVDLPAELDGVEIEIRPLAGSNVAHVAVVARPAPNGRAMHTAVFAGLREGGYELYRKPDGPVELCVDITGGEVTHAGWPGD